MKIVLVDTETTGIKTTDKVCEVAWMQVDENLNILAKGVSLINPGIPIDPAAGAVNGLTDAMVADAPTLDDYMEAVGQPLQGEDTIIVAHNISFDDRFLKPYRSENAKLLCTMRCARILYPDASNHKQSTLAYMFGLLVDREKAHSADGDLTVLLQLLERMCQDAGCGIHGLLEVQARPRVILTMPFGKHKGLALKDVPKPYVRWMLDNANMDDDLRAALVAL